MDSSARRCPRCDTQPLPGARFCAECGMSLASGCARCGGELPTAARFCPHCGGPTAEPRPDTGPTAPARPAAADSDEPLPETELRLVTVLFADIVGSTGLSERLTPEASADLINRCFEAIVPEIARFAGTVDKYTGDGVMARFGAPVTHEDDPERAIHAALGMQRALGRLHAGVQMRIGINTGPVVAGRMGAEGHREYTLIGDPVNVAKRLEEACPPGGVLVGEATQRLAAQAFRFDAPRPLRLRGKSAPVDAFLVLGEVTEPPDGLGTVERPLVGRDPELATLCDAAERAVAGHGQVVVVLGEPGVGKSRLGVELRRRLDGRVTFAQARCQSYRQSTPYAALGQLVRAMAGLGGVASTDRTVEGLDAWLASLPDLDGGQSNWRLEARGALLDVLGVHADGDIPEPRVRRERLGRAFVQVMAARARVMPLAIVVDDLQWIDESSLDVLDGLVQALTGLPILLAAFARPERVPPWSTYASAQQLTLGPLPDDHGRALLHLLLAGAEVPPTLADRLLGRTGGNPFFLEEIVASLCESGALRVIEGRWVLSEERSHDLPATVQEVLQARIDRLGRAERALLQVAAVIGRTFPEGLLRRVSGSEGEIDGTLRTLRRHELIYEQAVLPEPVYTFKHAVVQEVVYAGLPRARRRELHGRVAAGLVADAARSAEPPNALLAHHYSQAEAWQPARASLLAAARDAKERFANEEALALYGQLLAILERAATGEVSGLTPAGARLATIDVLSERHGVFGALERRAEEREDLERMRILAEEASDDLRLSNALNGLADFWIRGGGLAEAREMAEAALAIKSRLGDRAGQADALSNLAPLYGESGDYTAAKAANHRALELRREIGDEHGQIRSLDNLAVNYLYTGELTEAHEYVVEALTRARAIGYRGYELQAGIHLVAVLAVMGDAAGARAASEQAQALARAIGNRVGEGWTLEVYGIVELDEGRAAVAERLLYRALDLARATGSTALEVRVFYRLGDALMLLERFAEALVTLERSVAAADTHGFWIDRVLARAGVADAALSAGESEKARQYAEQTVALLADLSLDGVHEGQLVGWRLGKVFAALGDPRGAAYLSEARAVAQRRADGLRTPERRQTYLSRGFVRLVFDDAAPVDIAATK